jgi:hypothetical protein
MEITVRALKIEDASAYQKALEEAEKERAKGPPVQTMTVSVNIFVKFPDGD